MNENIPAQEDDDLLNDLEALRLNLKAHRRTKYPGIIECMAIWHAVVLSELVHRGYALYPQPEYIPTLEAVA